MQRFFDLIVYYLGFLAAISDSEIVQSMWFCPLPDRLAVVRVAFFYLKTNSSHSRIFRTSCDSQDTFCKLYQNTV